MIGYFGILDMFLALRQQYMQDRFKPFTKEMEQFQNQMDITQIGIMETLGVLTNGYLSAIEYLIDQYVDGQNLEENILFDMVFQPDILFLNDLTNVNDEFIRKKYETTRDSYNVKMQEKMSQFILHTWKHLYMPAKYKKNKELFDYISLLKLSVENPLEYITEKSDRVYVKDDQLHFRIEPKTVIDLSDIKSILITPTVFGTRDLTFWFKDNNLVFYVKLPEKSDGIMIPSDMMLLCTSALSDKTRLTLLKYLSVKQSTIGELAEYMKLNVSTISRHMKVFKDAGFVEIINKDQNTIVYGINSSSIVNRLNDVMSFLNIERG